MHECLTSVMKDMIRIRVDVFLQDEWLQQSKHCWSGAEPHRTFSLISDVVLRCTNEQIKPDHREPGKTHTHAHTHIWSENRENRLSLSRLKNREIREIDPRDLQFSAGLASRQILHVTSANMSLLLCFCLVSQYIHRSINKPLVLPGHFLTEKRFDLFL